MASDFSRIAIVTGTTSGIGEAVMRSLIANGYGVVGNGRTVEKLNQLEAELGAAFHGVAGDASDSTVIQQLFEAAEQHFGRPADTVVANAGRGMGGSVKDADLSEFDEVLNINVRGTTHLLQQAARKLVDLQKDRYPDAAADIVIIGSTVGRLISPFSSVYGATKFAVHALAEGLRREIGPSGVRVTLVEPAIVISGFQSAAGYSDELVRTFHDKFGPLLQSGDIANAIQYVVDQPPHVHVSDIMVRPTRQDYP
ncbi:SDR family oxidoreductase [Balneolales bacterium ANBcel1]|nr:SDR family oxidoreductase [Balneolales bacterium ANBcel1]